MSGRDQRGASRAASSYRQAGVDRDAASRIKERIRELTAPTAGAGVIAGPGGFGGVIRLPPGLEQPLLVASADGVGTKLKVAVRAGRHDTVGRDLVHHCINDILVEGARPLFFMDYIGMSRLEPGTVEELVAGMAAACAAHGCALLGGETAELPDFYAPGEYDLAGFMVGVVEESRRLGAHRVRAGDALIGLASDGFHTNGYSLLRRLLFDRLGLELEDTFPCLEARVGDVLLRVHKSYFHPVWPLLDTGRMRALAHVTGGGIPENLARVIPAGLEARVLRSAWRTPPEFRAVMERGAVPEEEMYRTFNMGVGMIAIVAAADAPAVVDELRRRGQDAWLMGDVQAGESRVSLV